MASDIEVAFLNVEQLYGTGGCFRKYKIFLFFRTAVFTEEPAAHKNICLSRSLDAVQNGFREQFPDFRCKLKGRGRQLADAVRGYDDFVFVSFSMANDFIVFPLAVTVGQYILGYAFIGNVLFHLPAKRQEKP